jgi:Anti-sigma factor NepR
MVENEKNKRRVNAPSEKIEKKMNNSAKPEVSDLISQRLRKFYNTMAEQPVPDRFMDLLDKLEAASTPKKPN